MGKPRPREVKTFFSGAQLRATKWGWTLCRSPVTWHCLECNFESFHPDGRAIFNLFTNSCLMGFVRIENLSWRTAVSWEWLPGSGLWKEQFDLWHSPVGAQLRLLLPHCSQEAEGRQTGTAVLINATSPGTSCVSRQPRRHIWLDLLAQQKILPGWSEVAAHDKEGERCRKTQVTHD